MLRHKKQPTPQELYWERKRREEEERDANLPPGLINHGNTCFMNSTLQGLIATPLLHSLVTFEDTPAASTSIAPYRSPQLTNGHGKAGKYEHDWVQGMPLGDVFVATMQKAWGIQESHRRESMSPKELLNAIGRKYDQYLDFRQQDAHEFLRHMLDAMRMEELDIIKVRQPPPPKDKRRRSRRPASEPQASGSKDTQTEHADGHGEDDVKLESFVDMLFGGKLASILVCDACKKISITYEDFNDLSLSIKPEDYVKARKRDRFKHIARKLRFKPKDVEKRETSPSSPHRSSSVPASPARRSMDPQPHEEPINVDHRRRSFDHVRDPDGAEVEAEAREEVRELARETVGEAKASALSSPAVEIEEVEPAHAEKPNAHVAFAEAVKDKKEKEKEDGWGKLGRRLSMSMGMAKKDKRLSRSRERGWKGIYAKDSDTSRAPSEERSPPLSSAKIATQSQTGSSSEVVEAIEAKNRVITPSPVASPLSTPPLNISRPLPNFRRHSAMSVVEKPPKPARPPKPTRQETAYLRRLLADVHATPSTFAMLQQAISGGSQSGSVPSSPVMSAQALLAKLGHMPGIEECLRLFTAVEVLDGDNMVGCHRCWKIANGTYKPRRKEEEEDDSEESAESPVIVPEAEELVAQMTRRPTRESSPEPSGRISPASTSYINGSAASSSIFLHETASVSSAPTTIQSVPPDPRLKPISGTLQLPSPPRTPDAPPESYGGLPIPSISTTEPESPGSTPNTARPPVLPTPPRASTSNASLEPPKPKKRKSSKQSQTQDDSDSSSDDGYDTSDASDDGSSYSDASSVASASPSGSRRTSLDKPNGQATPSQPDQRAERKVPRSEQVIMRRTFKRYLVAVPPPVLVIHLKRFQQVSKTNPYAMAFSSGFKKLDDFVAFPEYLDLAPFLAPSPAEYGLRGKHKKEKAKARDERCMYRLYAVVVHIGNMLGGHYIAYTALPPSRTHTETPKSETAPLPGSSSAAGSEKQPPRRWAYISDTVVRLTTLEEVLKAKAYICMYERI